MTAIIIVSIVIGAAIPLLAIWDDDRRRAKRYDNTEHLDKVKAELSKQEASEHTTEKHYKHFDDDDVQYYDNTGVEKVKTKYYDEELAAYDDFIASLDMADE